MTPLILVAHGSRHPGAAPVLEELAAAVGGRLAWLELSEPSLEQVCAELRDAGERTAVVVPLLFTEAFHRTVDLPAQAAAAEEATGVKLLVRDGVGLGPGVQKAVVRSFLDACDDPRDDVLLVAVGSSSDAANDAVHAFAAELGALLPGRVTAAFAIHGVPDLPRREGRGLVVVPLFTAPGRLWDRVAGGVAGAGVRVAGPLGARLADVVRVRALA